VRRRPNFPCAVLRHSALAGSFAESYRLLRANLVCSGVGEHVRTVVVTSATAGAGKTTTALNLAIVMAQAGQRIVVVDAGTGRPSAQEALSAAYGCQPPVPASPGLTELVGRSTELDVAMVSTAMGGLSIVPAGSAERHPSELLGSERMRAVLAELSARADCVLVDSPPCIGCSGSRLVARMADAVLYVVRSGSDQAVEKEALRLLHLARVRILGAVFNDVDLRRADGGGAPTAERQTPAPSPEVQAQHLARSAG
jgi:capsular exopolysaccharide synthesis family protein